MRFFNTSRLDWLLIGEYGSQTDSDLQRSETIGPGLKGACAFARSLLVSWARDERGSTAIEYALIAASIFLGVVGAAYTFGDKMSDMFDSISSTISATLH